MKLLSPEEAIIIIVFVEASIMTKNLILIVGLGNGYIFWTYINSYKNDDAKNCFYINILLNLLICI